MHTYEEIFNEVKKILTEEFEIPADKLVPEAHLVDDLDLDSIDAVDLVVRLQNIVGKNIAAEDFKAIRTLDDVIKGIEKIVNNA